MTKTQYKKDSLMYYANLAYSDIMTLAKSDLIKDKLIALNVLLFIVLISVLIQNYLYSGDVSFVFLFYFALSVIFSSILSLFYLPLIKVICFRHLVL